MLYLAGSIHRDLKGYERALRLLEAKRPDFICLECSEEQLNDYLSGTGLYQMRNQYINELELILEKLEKKGAPEGEVAIASLGLAVLRTLGFEFRAAIDYGSQNGIPVYPIGDNDLMHEINRRFPNRVYDIPETVGQNESSYQCWMDWLYYRPVLLDSKDLSAYLVLERDEVFEKKLKNSMNGGTGVFICGNAHFFANYEGHRNFYERMVDKNPQRMRLAELVHIKKPEMHISVENEVLNVRHRSA